MAAGDVIEQRSMRAGRRRRRKALAKPLCRREAPGEQPDRGRLDITLTAGDLAGEAQARHRVEPQRRVEELRRVEEGVAMQPPEPRELGVLQPRDSAEDAGLLAVLELRLE